MTNSLSLRAIVAGNIAAFATPAKAGTVLNNLQERMDALQADLAESRDLSALEVMGNNAAPAYRQGDVIIIREGDKRSGCDVAYRLKSGKSAIGQLVHRDDRNAYVRGFGPGDRLNGIPWNTIKTMGRIVLTSRA